MVLLHCAVKRHNWRKQKMWHWAWFEVLGVYTLLSVEYPVCIVLSHVKGNLVTWSRKRNVFVSRFTHASL